MKDDDSSGQVKRIVREDDGGVVRVPLKSAFFAITDIVTVSMKLEEPDVLLTLQNGVEYLLDNLEEPEEVYNFIVATIYKDEDDDDSD